MSKVIAFLCSPRKKGFSARLVSRVLDGARSAGAEVTVYDLNADGVKGCQGCFWCRAHDGCATRDRLQPMYDDIVSADGIVAGFPIYFGTVSGQSKLWMDRLYPMYGDNFVPRHPGKKMVTVYAQANGDSSCFMDAIRNTDGFFAGIGWEVIESLLIYGDVAPDYAVPDDLLERAYAAGRRLAGEE